MKRTLAVLFLLNFFFFACHETDKQLVADIEGQQELMAREKPDFDAVETGIAGLRSAMQQMPGTFDADSTAAKFIQLKNNIDQVEGKKTALIALYTDLQSKLESLLDDYESGKINTEAVRKELELIRTSTTESQAAVQQYKKLLEQFEAEYARLMSEYKAGQEAK